MVRINDRIKTLSEQAFAYAVTNGYSYTPTDYSTTPYTDVKGAFDMAYTAKFAELIINDCAGICELNSQHYKHSMIPMRQRIAEYSSKQCGMLIKKHFGIDK